MHTSSTCHDHAHCYNDLLIPTPHTITMSAYAIRHHLVTHSASFWLLTKLLIATGIVWLLLQHGSLDVYLLLEGAINLKIVVVGVALNMVMISLGAFRWHILLGSQGIALPFSWSHRMTYLAMCINLLVPGAVGGDALRMGYVAKKTTTAQKTAAILTIIADRFTGLYSLFVLALLATLLNLSTVLTTVPMRMLALGLVLVVVVGPIAMVILFWTLNRVPKRSSQPANSGAKIHWFDTIIQQTNQAAALFQHAKTRIILAVLISAIAQTVEIIALLWIARSLGIISLPANHLFVAAPLAWVANVLPVSPGGLGVGEAAFAQLCQWLQPTATTVAFGTIFLVNRILQMVASLPGLWVYLLYCPDSASPLQKQQ